MPGRTETTQKTTFSYSRQSSRGNIFYSISYVLNIPNIRAGGLQKIGRFLADTIYESNFTSHNFQHCFPAHIDTAVPFPVHQIFTFCKKVI
jgi:hypothetical protein